MQFLSDLVTQRMSEMQTNGQLTKMVDEHIAKYLKDILDNSLRIYSDVGKKVQKKFEECLNADLEKVSMVEYSSLIAKMLETKFNQVINEHGLKIIDDFLKDALELVPETITLEELLEEYKEILTSDEDRRIEGKLFLKIDEKENNFQYIYFDEDSKSSKYSATYQIILYKGKVWKVVADGQSSEKPFQFATGFAKKLLQLAYRKTNLIVDGCELDYDLEYSNADY